MEVRAADVHVLSLLSSSSAGFDPFSDIIRGPPSLSLNVPGIMRHKGKSWWQNDLNLLYNESVRHTSLLESPSVTLMTTFSQADWSQTGFFPPSSSWCSYVLRIICLPKLHSSEFLSKKGEISSKQRMPGSSSKEPFCAISWSVVWDWLIILLSFHLSSKTSPKIYLRPPLYLPSPLYGSRFRVCWMCTCSQGYVFKIILTFTALDCNCSLLITCLIL